MPRKRLIVPMVTTIEGSPSPVTSKPLKAPQTRPVADADGDQHRRAGAVLRARPISVEASAMIAATDRSISPAMISSAMASAISAFSVKLKVSVGEAPGVEEIGRGEAS